MGESRDRWLKEAVEVLAEEGASGVRIDRIAVRLGLSKGSFHHHFDGADGFKKELLAYIEQLLTGALHNAVDDVDSPQSTRDIVMHLVSLVSDPDGGVYRPDLETAVRAWALTDSDAARAQANIDAARLEILRAIWGRASTDEEEVRLSALLPYVIAVGSAVIMPPVRADDLQGLYELILPLVPEETITADPSFQDGDEVTRSGHPHP